MLGIWYWLIFSTIGQPKVEIAKQRIHDINPDIVVDAFNMFFDENNAPDVKPDFVIDAIDTVKSKIALYKWCANNKIAFVSSMGAARKTDITKIKIANTQYTSLRCQDADCLG